MTENKSKITIEYHHSPTGAIYMLSRFLVQPIFMAIDAALERFGNAARFVEVIKATPMMVILPKEDLINIKVVMAFPRSRTEKDFQFSFSHTDRESSNTALTQRIINCLQEILNDEANESRKIARELTDAYRGFICQEQLSGNSSRCPECGTVREQTETGYLKKCSKCNPPSTTQPLLIDADPTCPKCKTSIIRTGNLYTCSKCDQTFNAVVPAVL